MNSNQLNHQQTENKSHDLNISILCDDIRTPENIGMVFRVAEAFGIGCIYLTENCPNTENSRVRKTSRSTYNQIPSIIINDKRKLLKELKADGYQLLGLEITDSSIRIQDLNIEVNAKILLVIGSERNGINAQVLNELDEYYHIEMFGDNSSINVVNALSIALYQLSH